MSNCVLVVNRFREEESCRRLNCDVSWTSSASMTVLSLASSLLHRLNQLYVALNHCQSVLWIFITCSLRHDHSATVHIIRILFLTVKYV